MPDATVAPSLHNYQAAFQMDQGGVKYVHCQAGDDSTALKILMERIPSGAKAMAVHMLHPVMEATFPTRRALPKNIHHSNL